MQPILFSVSAFVSTILGGLFLLRHKERLHYVISFTAGVIIAVCFFDIIPEMFKVVSENKLDITPSLIALILGFLIIHVLEKYIVIHHSHEAKYATHKHPHVGAVSASGLIFHSFLDGVGIGLGFHIDPHIGILIAIAVIAHDFSDGINTISLMLLHKNTMKKSMLFLGFDALAPVLGVLSTFLVVIPDRILVLYLGFFAGFLLYIGASDLLPEAHSKGSSFKMIGLTILGIIFIFFITRFT